MFTEVGGRVIFAHKMRLIVSNREVDCIGEDLLTAGLKPPVKGCSYWAYIYMMDQYNQYTDPPNPVYLRLDH